MSTSESQNARVTRKSLKTLQHTAFDTENLVGRPSKSLKHQLVDPPADVEVKRKTVLTKETQVNLETKVSVEDLTNPKKASENYWKILAEKTQAALQDTLVENEQLRKMIEDLKEENAQYKQMLEEANSFVEVIKEELANNSNDDTGIDVNDVSNGDEVPEDSETST